MSNLEKIAQAVIAGDVTVVKALAEAALAADEKPEEIINNGLIAGMNVVGKRFKAGDMFVPEVLMSAKAMHAGMEPIKPLLAGGKMATRGTIVLGTVKGDLHDIGKNLVGMLLEANGLEVVDLGVDVESSLFIKAAKENSANIIAMSALLTTTMLTMKQILELLEEEGLRDKYKVIVGGAPVSQDFSDEIGADGFAPDASSAADLCLQLLEA